MWIPESLRKLAVEHPYWAAFFVIAAVVVLIQRQGWGPGYAVAMLAAYVWASADPQARAIYFFAYLLGMTVAFAEIVGKFTSEPLKALGTWQSLIYHVGNGAISAATLWYLIVARPQDFPIETAAQRASTVALAGFGAMVVLRSRLFSMKVGGEDVAFGPEQIVKVFFRYLETGIDRASARDRKRFVENLMQNVPFAEAYDYTVTMLESSQRISPEELKTLNDKMEALKNKKMEPRLQSFHLGFLVLNQMGEDFVGELFSKWQPATAPQPWSLGEKYSLVRQESVTYFSYGVNMSLDRIFHKLGWPVVQGRRFLAPKAKPARLPGFRLLFNSPIAAGSGVVAATANLVDDQGSEVYGVIYELPKNALDFLERSEPTYRLREVSVPVPGAEPAKWMIFVAKQTQPGLKPTRGYLGLLISGAIEQGLPPDYIQSLERIETLSEEEILQVQAAAEAAAKTSAAVASGGQGGQA